MWAGDAELKKLFVKRYCHAHPSVDEAELLERLTESGHLAADIVGAWDAIPALGKWQIISIIFALEVYSELQKPHYMKGGPIGSIPALWDPFDIVVRKKIAKMTPEEKLVSLNKELNNGRLAMIGAMGFSASAMVPGSVPLVPDGVF